MKKFSLSGNYAEYQFPKKKQDGSNTPGLVILRGGEKDPTPHISKLPDGDYEGKRYGHMIKLKDGRTYRTNEGVRNGYRGANFQDLTIKNGDIQARSTTRFSGISEMGGALQGMSYGARPASVNDVTRLTIDTNGFGIPDKLKDTFKIKNKHFSMNDKDKGIFTGGTKVPSIGISKDNTIMRSEGSRSKFSAGGTSQVNKMTNVALDWNKDEAFHLAVEPWITSSLQSDTDDGLYIGHIKGDKIDIDKGVITLSVSVKVNYPEAVLVLIKNKKAYIFKQSQLAASSGSKIFSNVLFSDITTNEQFRDYAHNLMKKAHGDNYSEAKTDKVVDGLLAVKGEGYGAKIGKLKASLGNRKYSNVWNRFYADPNQQPQPQQGNQPQPQGQQQTDTNGQPVGSAQSPRTQGQPQQGGQQGQQQQQDPVQQLQGQLDQMQQAMQQQQQASQDQIGQLQQALGQQQVLNNDLQSRMQVQLNADQQNVMANQLNQTQISANKYNLASGAVIPEQMAQNMEQPQAGANGPVDPNGQPIQPDQDPNQQGMDPNQQPQEGQVNQSYTGLFNRYYADVPMGDNAPNAMTQVNQPGQIQQPTDLQPINLVKAPSNDIDYRFEYQPAASPMMEMQAVIGTLVMSSSYVHLYHLCTNTYSEHMALDEYYKEMPEKVDKLAEAYLETTPSANFQVCVVPSTPSPTGYLEALREYITVYTKSVPNMDSYMNSLMDDILSLISSTLYKLKRLKMGRRSFSFTKSYSDDSHPYKSTGKILGSTKQAILDIIDVWFKRNRKSPIKELKSMDEVVDFVKYGVNDRGTAKAVTSAVTDALITGTATSLQEYKISKI